MNSALQILCHRLFDYAGLFPPANLDLKSALKNYIDYQTHEYRDMLSKFVLPAKKTHEVRDFLNQQKIDSVILFSVLLSQAKHSNVLFDTLEEDYNTIFLLTKYKNCLISAFEFSLPPDCLREEEHLFLLFDNIQNKFLSLGNLSKEIDFFCEIPFLPNEEMVRIFSKIKQYNQFKKHKISIKLRTGGTTPQSIPTIEMLTNTFLLLAEHSLPFKVTAGLHVPVPNFNATVNAHMHGFLNVLFSSMFAFFSVSHLQKNKNNIKQKVEALLKSIEYSNCNIQKDRTSISINDSEFIFLTDMIFQFREKYFKGIGTCDFLEPIDLLFEKYKIEN